MKATMDEAVAEHAAVLERMMKAGWLRGYERSSLGFLLQWTDKGNQQAEELKRRLQIYKPDVFGNIPTALARSEFWIQLVDAATYGKPMTAPQQQRLFDTFAKMHF